MIKIMPHIQKVKPKEDDKKKDFVSSIQKPRPKTNNTENKLSFIKV